MRRLNLIFLLFILLTGRNLLAQNVPPVAENQCISLNAPVYSSKPAEDWTQLDALIDGSDQTFFVVTGPVELALQINAGDIAADSLILHWRAVSWENRNIPLYSLHNFEIYASNNSTNGSDGDWQLLDTYQNHSKDNYVLFPNTHAQWIKVKELTSNVIKLSRLEVFTPAPAGKRNDIWLFFGDSETKGDMGVGNTNYQASIYFGNQIHQDFPCFYPIILNGGKGGERATEAVLKIDSILDAKPEIAFVAFNYGINDLLINDLLPYSDHANDPALQDYVNAFTGIIDKCVAKNRFPIPSRIPWIHFPNSYYGYVDTSPDKTNGIRPFNTQVIDPLIAQKTPYAIDPATGLPYADMDTWFHQHRDDPQVFLGDKVHHDKLGINRFNIEWVTAAEAIVYSQQDASCSGGIDTTGNTGEIFINCPENFIVTLPSGQNQMPVSWDLPQVSTTCPVSSQIQISQIAGGTSGNSFTTGTHIVTYQAADSCNNQATCSFSFSVYPAPQPFDCGTLQGFDKIGEFQGHGYYLSQDVLFWEQARDQAISTGGYLAAIHSQEENTFLKAGLNQMAQDLALIGYNDEMEEGNPQWANYDLVTLDLGMNNNPQSDFGTLQSWDGNWGMISGNIAKKYILEIGCTAAIPDSIEIVCPDDISVELNPGQADTLLQWTAPSATTNCPNPNINIFQIGGPQPGTAFPPGSYTISYTAANECGNADTCSFDISVTPSSTSPQVSIACPGDISVELNPGQADTLLQWTAPSATTNCPNPGINIFQISGPQPGTAFAPGSYTISYTAVNECGNADTCAFQISVMPSSTSPQIDIACPGNISVQLAFGQTDSIVNWAMPVATTTCPDSNLIVSQLTGPLPGASLQAGVYEISFLATDGCNLNDSCSFSIEVLAGQTPNLILTCPEDIWVLLPEGSTDTVLTWPMPTANSNCYLGGVSISQIGGPAPGSNLSTGIYPMNYTASDQCGSVSSCNFLVEVDTSSQVSCNQDSLRNFDYIGFRGGHKYFLSQHALTWQQAQEVCETLGGYLAVINHADENYYLSSRIGDDAVFIGLTDEEVEGQPVWIDGGGYIDNIQNNADSLDFGVLTPWTGRLMMVSSSAKKHFLLERSCLSFPKGAIAHIHNTYPVPTTGSLNLIIELSREMSLDIRLINLQGQEIWHFNKILTEGEQLLEFDLSDLKSGVYFISIRSEDYRAVKKIVKI